MSRSSPPRVARKHAPAFQLRKTTYSKSKPYLLLDFDGRCAYSMQHGSRCDIQVDHFDPTKKKDSVQHYENLFPASSHCNNAKRDTWPSKAMQLRGFRLLNCCKEADYDHVIFEDPNTHLLIGSTVSARFHIEVCDLNAPHLVSERKKRAEYRRKLEASGPIQFAAHVPFEKLADLIRAFREEVETMIPPIKPPPINGSAYKATK